MATATGNVMEYPTPSGGQLHENRLFILYNDPSGWFGRAEALWVGQDNTGYDKRAGAVVIASVPPMTAMRIQTNKTRTRGGRRARAARGCAPLLVAVDVLDDA